MHTAAVDRGPDVDGGIEVAVAVEDPLVKLNGLLAVSDPQVERVGVETVIDDGPALAVDGVVDMVPELVDGEIYILLGCGMGKPKLPQSFSSESAMSLRRQRSVMNSSS